MHTIVFLIIMIVCLFLGCWIAKSICCKDGQCCKWGFWPWLLALLWIGISTWYFACCIKGLCGSKAVETSKVAAPIQKVATPKVAKDYGPLSFALSSAAPVLGKNFSGYISDIIGKRGQNQNLTIVGKYFADETNGSSFKNLGLARATKVKNAISKWISGSDIEISSQNLGNRPAGLDKLFPSVSFSYTEKPKPSFTAEMVGSKRLIYFDFASSQTAIAPDLRNYLQKVAVEAKELEKSVYVTGHTDNIGDAQMNQSLGQKRADMIQAVLVEYGLSNSQVIANSQGETNPMTTNETKEGRAKNRRVEIEFR